MFRYTEGLSQTESQTLRGQLVERLMMTAKEQGDAEALSFCESQRETALDRLQRLNVDDIDWAMSLVQSKANPTEYLRST